MTKRAILSLISLLVASGCLSERSIPMRTNDIRLVASAAADPRLTTREWLRSTQSELRSLQPCGAKDALVTDELKKPDGTPVDVMRHFDMPPGNLQKLLLNYFGLSHTAQLVGRGYSSQPEECWPGFTQVWIPVADNVSLSGWMAMARHNGEVIDSNCIVLLPGLLGRNDVRRTRDLAEALLKSGHHVLALELRGHGLTNLKYPDVYYTFGIIETADLLKVSEWLDDQPHVLSSGLIGFCWGANHALLAAWFDSRSPDDACVSPELKKRLGPTSSRRHFTAGVMAISGAYRFEDLCDLLEHKCNYWTEPVTFAVQELALGRAIDKKHSHQDGSLRTLIDDEFARSELNYPHAVQESYIFMRFLPYKDQPGCDRLSRIRIPTLIVSASNDPMTGGQPVADLICTSDNPNVAALVTAGGGHNGFAAWSRKYYYSLILSFFDGKNGPGAMQTAGN